jgi:catechol 2,3-dioxygenase
MSDHTVSQSLYLRDPDGNEVELFVDDVSVDWRSSADWMHDPVKPLRL